MTIHTYYAPLSIKGDPTNDYRLLLLWKKNWERWGYDTCVLNEHLAMEHLMYQQFSDRIDRLPSINPPGYDRACYLRHLAMLQVGGGLMSDYDLFAYSDPKKAMSPFITKGSSLVCFQKHVPCLLWGTKDGFSEMVRGIMEYEVGTRNVQEFGRPHVSDMHILLNGDVRYERHAQVLNFGEPGWESAPFTHWSSCSMIGHNPKWKYIPQLRN
jgi:hypothetical protein